MASSIGGAHLIGGLSFTFFRKHPHSPGRAAFYQPALNQRLPCPVDPVFPARYVVGWINFIIPGAESSSEQFSDAPMSVWARRPPSIFV